MDPIILKTIFTDGKDVEISTVASDLIAFEERFDMSIAGLSQNVRMTHLFFIAWHALKRTGQTKDDFDKWVEGVNMVTVADSKK